MSKLVILTQSPLLDAPLPLIVIELFVPSPDNVNQIDFPWVFKASLPEVVSNLDFPPSIKNLPNCVVSVIVTSAGTSGLIIAANFRISKLDTTVSYLGV